MKLLKYYNIILQNYIHRRWLLRYNCLSIKVEVFPHTYNFYKTI